MMKNINRLPKEFSFYSLIFLSVLFFPFTANTQTNPSNVDTQKNYKDIQVLEDKIIKQLEEELGPSNHKAYLKFFAPQFDPETQTPAPGLYTYTMSPYYKKLPFVSPFYNNKTNREYYERYFAELKPINELALEAVNGGIYRKNDNSYSSEAPAFPAASLSSLINDNILEAYSFLNKKKYDDALNKMDFCFNFCKSFLGDTSSTGQALITGLSWSMNGFNSLLWLDQKPEFYKKSLDCLNSHTVFNNRDFIYSGDFLSIYEYAKTINMSYIPLLENKGLWDKVYAAAGYASGDDYYTNVNLTLMDTLISEWFQNPKIFTLPENTKWISTVNSKRKFDGTVGTYKRSRVSGYIERLKKIAAEEPYFNQKILFLSDEDVNKLTAFQKIYIICQMNSYYHPYNENRMWNDYLSISENDKMLLRFQLIKTAFAARYYMDTKGALPKDALELFSEGLTDEAPLPLNAKFNISDIYKMPELKPLSADIIVLKMIMQFIKPNFQFWNTNLGTQFEEKKDGAYFEITVKGEYNEEYVNALKDTLKFFSDFIEIEKSEINIEEVKKNKSLTLKCKYKRPKSFIVVWSLLPNNENPLTSIAEKNTESLYQRFSFLQMVGYKIVKSE